MLPRWLTGVSEDVPPIAVPVSQPTVVQSSEKAGIRIPPRLPDCSGVRPSWYPFQNNVCDVDAPDPDELSGRQLKIPDWPY